MLYKIAGIVVFNPEDGTLTRDEDGEAVKLTLPASRLLEALLTAPHGLMEREVLLTEVWDKYGLCGSHNNLNQYVSILRRTLSSLGCEGLIITVPKVGFRLNPEVNILPEEKSPEPAHSPVDSGAVVHTPPTSLAAQGAGVSSRFGNVSLLLLAVLLVLMAGFTLMKTSQWSVQEVYPVAGGSIDQCKLFFLQSINSSEREKFRQNAISILRENQVSCSSNRIVFIDNYVSKNSANLGRTLLSACRLSDENKVVDCMNFYYLDRR